MRIFDLRIDLPDFWPVPRILQEHGGNVPECVTALHDIPLGMSRIQRNTARTGGLCGKYCTEAGADIAGRGA